MIDALLKTLHLAGVIVWIGGMVFAHFFLRPAAAALEPPARLTLMHGVLSRFFAAVSVASLVVLISGVVMIGRTHSLVSGTGGRLQMPFDWWAMALLGVVMVAIFGWIRLGLFPRLARAVAAGQWPAGGAAMNEIRRWVTVNLALGSVIVVAVLMV